MEPRNRLWVDLIFWRCEMADLLSLRAVCRAFLAHLNASPRLWQPWTMDMWRMSHAERLLGWRGVERAMERERNTRVNCEAGRFTSGPVLNLTHEPKLMLVGGRIVVFGETCVTIFAAETGAPVTTIATDYRVRNVFSVQDRWVTFLCDVRTMLLDCIDGELTILAEGSGFRVCGPRVSYSKIGDDCIYIVHVSKSPDGTATRVEPVARVTLNHYFDELMLCQRGRSYIYLDWPKKELLLCDAATQSLIRTFSFCASVVPSCVAALTRARARQRCHRAGGSWMRTSLSCPTLLSFAARRSTFIPSFAASVVCLRRLVTVPVRARSPHRRTR